MSEERIAKHIYQFVEAELHEYKTYKKLIAEYDAQISMKSSLGGDITGRFAQNKTSDSTSSEAIRMMANYSRICRMMDICRCIEDVLEQLSEEDYKMTEMLYFKGWYTDYGIMRELCIPRRTYYRHKRGIIRQFALRMKVL